MIFIIYYSACLVYCMWRSLVMYKETSFDGIIDTSPALDTTVIVILCWALAPIDLFLTVLNKVKNEDSRGY